MDLERIAKLEARVEGIKDDVKEMREDIKELHSRVTTQTREIVEKMDDMQTRIEHRMTAGAELAKQQHKEIQEEIQKDVKDIAERVESINTRVDTLEHWRWMIVGGAVVLGYVLGHVNIFAKLVG